MRIVELPAPLCPDGKIAVQVLLDRPDPVTVSYAVFLGEATGEDEPSSYSLLGAGDKFAQRGMLIGGGYRENTFTVDSTVGFTVQLEGVDTLFEEQSLFTAMENRLLCFIDDEILSVQGWALTAVNTYRITAVRGRFGTARAEHLEGADVYFLPLAGINALQSPVFQHGNTPTFKVLSVSPNRNVGLEDVDPVQVELSALALNLPPLSNLKVNGGTRNAFYDQISPLEISWTLPDAAGLDMSQAYTLLEFIEGVDVIHTQKVAWPGLSLEYTYPAVAPATFILRASIVIDTGWELISSRTSQVTVNATGAT